MPRHFGGGKKISAGVGTVCIAIAVCTDQPKTTFYVCSLDYVPLVVTAAIKTVKRVIS